MEEAKKKMTSIIGMLYRESQQVLDVNLKVAKAERRQNDSRIFRQLSHLMEMCFAGFPTQTCWDTLYNVLEAATCGPPYSSSMLEDYCANMKKTASLMKNSFSKPVVVSTHLPSLFC